MVLCLDRGNVFLSSLPSFFGLLFVYLYTRVYCFRCLEALLIQILFIYQKYINIKCLYIYIKGIGDDNEFRNGDGLVGSVQSVETVKSSKNPLPNSNSQSSETQNTTQMEAIRVLFEQEGPQSLNCFIAFGGCFTKHRFQSSGSRAGRVSEVH